MVQKVPFTSATGNTMTIGTGTSRVVMGADSGNLKIQDSHSNTSVIEAGLGVQGAGSGVVVVRVPGSTSVSVAPGTNSVSTLPSPAGGCKVARFTVSGTLTIS